ncbi:MAG: metallophosphoesterase [Chitinophagaceae bacterium]|nr:MAG: metallophosphoesterase [Chitinophagaceae bacterium]
MKILLISDTHSHLDEGIISNIKEADEVWHAGDIGNPIVEKKISELKPLRAVYGNIDGHELRRALPEEVCFRFNGMTIFMTHIGGYPGRYQKGIKEKLMELKPDIFICGHSHILKVIYDKNLNLLHMNPGAAGLEGFHQIRTMLRFEINEGKIEKLEIIELGKRGSVKKA